MSLLESLRQASLYIAEAIVAIFSPLRDEVPPVGVQPYRAEFPGAIEDWPEPLACPLSCPIHPG